MPRRKKSPGTQAARDRNEVHSGSARPSGVSTLGEPSPVRSVPYPAEASSDPYTHPYGASTDFFSDPSHFQHYLKNVEQEMRNRAEWKRQYHKGQYQENYTLRFKEEQE